MNSGTWGSSGRTGTSGGGSFVGIGSLVTPCHGFTSRIGTVIDGNISFYCNICDKRILREDFITIEEYTNKVRFDKLKDILNE